MIECIHFQGYAKRNGSFSEDTAPRLVTEIAGYSSDASHPAWAGSSLPDQCARMTEKRLTSLLLANYNSFHFYQLPGRDRRNGNVDVMVCSTWGPFGLSSRSLGTL